MNKIIRLKIVSLLIIGILLLNSVAAGSAQQSALTATPAVVSMPGRQVVLRAEPTDSFFRVEPPPEFSRSGVQSVKTANIVVTYVGAWNASAQAAFQFAADLWETQINSPVTINVRAEWNNLGGSILGAAGPVSVLRDFSGAPVSNTWYPVALANALSGSDLNNGGSDEDGDGSPVDAEIAAEFNSGFSSWYFGTDGSTPSGQYDFVSVVLHELGHGLGFLGSMTVSGGQGSWGLGTGFPLSYDRFAVNGSGQSLINTGLFANPSAALATQLTSNNVFFNGANAVAANGGNVKLYAPGAWSQGSSYAHLDEVFNGTANALMTYSINTAESVHSPGPVTLAMFRDMGWPTSSIVYDEFVYLPVVKNNWPPQLSGSFYSNADAVILQGYPATNFGSTGDMWAGYDDYLNPDGMIVRSLIKFDTSAIPNGSTINSAVLQVYMIASWDYPSRSRTITAYRISSNWAESTVTWNTQPGIAEAYGSAAIVSGAFGWYSFDVTNLVRAWKNGTYSDYGVMLRGPEQSGSDSSWRSFSTREGGYTPKINITYIGASGLSHLEISADGARLPQGAQSIIEALSAGYRLDAVCSADALRVDARCIDAP
ncbi:MAG TPA: DNRLRE domain-containing protein [Anaerolineae bacterium]